VVSFIVSCFVDPEIFGSKSINASKEFYQMLLEDSSPQMSFLLKEVINELDAQKSLTQVFNIQNKMK
jgi:hypothetical protein